MRKGCNKYVADEGKHFVLTEKGHNTSANFSQYEIGSVYEDWEHYIPFSMIDDGIFEEVNDPDWIEMPGYKVVHDYKGTQLYCGNPIVFHDKEMAERYKKLYEKLYKKWLSDEVPYIAEEIYKGKRPVPNKEYQGKTVFVMENWCCDVGRIGDLVEHKIAMEIANCVPPRNFSTGYIQCGEPSDHCKEGILYATFVRVDDDVWEYKGECLAGHTEQDWTPIPIV